MGLRRLFVRARVEPAPDKGTWRFVEASLPAPLTLPYLWVLNAQMIAFLEVADRLARRQAFLGMLWVIITALWCAQAVLWLIGAAQR